MDFGVGFISTNIMLPILDFFFRIVHSYGFAIIALTLVVRFAVFPLSAGQIRNMRKMRITQPLMKERQAEIQQRYKNDPQKQQEEMGKLMQELGNPLAGCLPLLLQMPILLALFATLRGSPFSDINYTVDLQVLPSEQIALVQRQPYATKPQNVYIDESLHYPITAFLPQGNKIAPGEQVKIDLQNDQGKSLGQLATEAPENNLKPTYEVVKGQELVQVNEDGSIVALAPGDASIKVINQELSGAGAPSGGAAQQQQTVNKITPIIFSMMFLFFPLPAGVLMYILTANIFQTIQTVILMREPLPENLQKLVAEQEKTEKTRDALPFEKRSSKKKEKTS